MPNYRISELSPIIPGELSEVDLLLISDVSATESKRLTLSDLTTYVLSGSNGSGSFFGTSSWAQHTLSSSYVSGTLDGVILKNNVYSQFGKIIFNSVGQEYVSAGPYIGNVLRSAAGSRYWANSSNVFQAAGGYLYDFFGNQLLSASVFTATGSLYGTSSWAETASYVLVTNTVTASFANVAALSNTASYIYYVPGGNNGTASFAATASITLQTITASFAVSSSQASTATVSISSSQASTASVAIIAQTTPYATVAGQASVATNGIFEKRSTISYITRSNNGITEGTPDSIPNLVITSSVINDSPTYLINLFVAVGGVTGISLWRSSSAGSTALMSTIGISSSSLSSVTTIGTSYMDTPTAIAGDTIYYRACVHNNSGSYYVNTSFDGTRFGTSSLNVIQM